ncbi:MAG: DUF1080 domain-containing protein [Verrucomicrobiota bacterium]
MLIFATLFGSLAAIADEGFHIFECMGNYDTPLIPGSEYRVHDKDRPQPPYVTPPAASESAPVSAPSDAIVLFDGSSMDQFGETEWKIVDGVLVAGKGNIVTCKPFGDCQLHVEWRAPNPPSGNSCSMGNSGLKFMYQYELQIFDSYSCKIYADGSAAAIYGQSPPLVNVSRKPGEWQTFDVVFTAPDFEDGELKKPGSMTVFHNGVLVQQNTEILGPTTHKNTKPYKAHKRRLPLMIQGHNSPVEFRNIWIRDLEVKN